MTRRAAVVAGIATAAAVAAAAPLVGQTSGGAVEPAAAATLHEQHSPMTFTPADPAALDAARKEAFAPAATPPPQQFTSMATNGTRIRHYWIKAVNVKWDVAPNGQDVLTARRVDPVERQLDAVVYRAYTPGWKKPLPNRAVAGDNDGVPGPVIEARVGDTIHVHFKNEDRVHKLPHSMHFHAFSYAPGSDGAYIPQISGRGGNVPVGKSFTYKLTAGPQSHGAWPYHDHSSSMHESIPQGLYGVVAVYRKNEKPPDRRFVVAFAEHKGFNTINGRAFIGNTPTFQARVGETVEWNVISMGELFHTFHTHGHRWLNHAGVPIDNQEIGPGGSFRMRWREDAPGTWYYHCHVESHQMNGMIGLYKVTR
ncbi:multicopper oxidase domain-containing protein [Miltoncostaea marina]|uniref:multicopper oxidase domain-containing protein n=1 Tax=Miltoncostaea marina TaxID=2843215 RepID=UPI001C3D66C6|nr:multicopper oxidase domain-containing protein [Miltoncostaea marina]